MAPMDEVDLKILDILERDARTSYRQIATELGIGVSTVGRRIAALEKKGIIEGYAVRLNYDTLAKEAGLNFFPICFFIRIRPGYEVRRVVESIAKTESYANICYVYHVAGDFEIAAMARCLSRKEATKLVERISKIEGVERITPHAVLETYKEGAGPGIGVIRRAINDRKRESPTG
ncbi:MAG: Lrp/AsnC family transcriptional regulator [Candidatus Freyarchaeota archaeon]